MAHTYVSNHVICWYLREVPVPYADDLATPNAQLLRYLHIHEPSLSHTPNHVRTSSSSLASASPQTNYRHTTTSFLLHAGCRHARILV